MKRFSLGRILAAAAFAVAALGLAPAAQAVPTKADFVFVIDATGSMGGEIAAVKAGLGDFVTGLNAAQVDARFAVVLFGGAPELVQDFTSSGAATETTFDTISVNNAVAGFQNNHNANPEAGLEAIRIVLGGAANNALLRTNVGGSGPLAFRNDARKNIILVTDEDSDSPYYHENRFAGESGFGNNTDGNFGDPPGGLGGGWQAEIDATAQAVIDNSAFVNILDNPNETPSATQYGNPGSDAADANFLNFDAAQTLANLIAGGFGNSLEAQVLQAGLIGRSFNINNVNNANFIDNFFAAKIEETVENPIPEPATMAIFATGLLGLGLARRRRNA